jgi:preprotein translocase subunit SecA
MQKNLLKTNSFTNNYQRLINEINNFEDDFKTLSTNELRSRNIKLQKQYKKTNNLNSLLVESFALTKEASLRTLGLKHFDVQLIGGLVLNNQKIAEMKTGEGKTLVATLPACLNALTKKGVHIITVNDYLANRDQISMSQIYRFLGFSTGLIQGEMSKLERKKNYEFDITYVTNYEVTFDFLRDNMALNLSDVVLRPFNYCIIDEVDSILIDEAQTPLILSDTVKTPTDKYIIASEITDYLDLNIHYKIDEKNKNIILTDAGSKQIEKILRVPDLYNPRDPWIPYVINALKANSLFFNNIHYIVQNDRIIIVDEFTGRIMADRRWSDGLHQAIEAKEKVPIRKNTETVAAITYQNFFLLYPKLSGMTGTGKTAEIEFEKIYNLAVEEIPTAKPNIRKDLSDVIYKDQFSKWNSIAQACNEISSTGQPILIGTTTVEKSEMLAQLLNEYKLSYQILNAKPENVRRESEIIAQAGQKYAITIATNMAGRGTDIVLGGNINFQIQKELYDILTLLKNYTLLKKINIFR